MNGQQPPQTFTDFLQPTVSDEGPVETSNIERQRYHKRRMAKDKMKSQRRRKRRAKRAS